VTTVVVSISTRGMSYSPCAVIRENIGICDPL